MNESELRESIVAACQRLYNRNCLAAADGNVSYRISNERILITPSGVAKAFLAASEMAIMDIEGRILEGRPSGERLMHLAIYRQCPEAKAVVHAHPPHAIAWSLSEPGITELPNDVLPEVILAAGRIPIVSYARPGTEAMGENLRSFLPQSRLMILERHGAVAWGESMNEAVGGLERLEHSAQILWLARALGPLRKIDTEEQKALVKMRETLGPRLL